LKDLIAFNIKGINCVLVVHITTVEDLTAVSAECLTSAATNRRRAAKKEAPLA